MSWYSVGDEAAEVMAATTVRRRQRNFFTKADESARIRFLARASDSFNYKRCFVPWAQGQKLLTSPDVQPNPFQEAGLTLQAAFAWPILDKREIEYTDREGKDQKTGPRVLYFADGVKCRRQLISFEKEVLAAENESRQEDGKEPLTLDEFNLTSYDVKVVKPKGGAWSFVALRPGKLKQNEQEIVEKYPIDFVQELAPLTPAELRNVLKTQPATEEADEPETEYSYSSDSEDVIQFN